MKNFQLIFRLFFWTFLSCSRGLLHFFENFNSFIRKIFFILQTSFFVLAQIGFEFIMWFRVYLLANVVDWVVVVGWRDSGTNLTNYDKEGRF
jgi:hypothetical protein